MIRHDSIRLSRGLILFVAFLFFVIPGVVFADNCNSFFDCFNTAAAATAAAAALAIAGIIIDAAVGASPLGTAATIYEAITGKHYRTGEPVDTDIWDVALSLAPLGVGKAAKHLTKAAKNLDAMADAWRAAGRGAQAATRRADDLERLANRYRQASSALKKGVEAWGVKGKVGKAGKAGMDIGREISDAASRVSPGRGSSTTGKGKGGRGTSRPAAGVSQDTSPNSSGSGSSGGTVGTTVRVPWTRRGGGTSSTRPR